MLLNSEQTLARKYAAILDNSIPSTNPILPAIVENDDGSFDFKYGINPGELARLMVPSTFFRDQLEKLNEEMVLIPGLDFKIPPVGDSHPLIIPASKGCEIEQIAIYSDSQEGVHIVGGIWEKLSNLDKAALLIHEVVYRRLREFGDTNSDRTRKIVGFIFSNYTFEWPLNDLALEGRDNRILLCWSQADHPEFQFVVKPHNDSWVEIQFLIYDGEILLTKTLAQAPLAPFAEHFGLSIPEDQRYQTKFEKLQNPFVKNPKWSFSVNTDFDSNGNPIKTVGGSIGVSTAVNERIAYRPIRCRQQTIVFEKAGNGTSIIIKD